MTRRTRRRIIRSFLATLNGAALAQFYGMMLMLCGILAAYTLGISTWYQH